MIRSGNITHATAEVYINGKWVILNNQSGGLFLCTHPQLLELMSGVKNDAYRESLQSDGGMDPIIVTASTNPTKVSDLSIKVTPTHNPSDTSIR